MGGYANYGNHIGIVVGGIMHVVHVNIIIIIVIVVVDVIVGVDIIGVAYIS